MSVKSTYIRSGYGSQALWRAYCHHCHAWSFVIDERMACCGGPPPIMSRAKSKQMTTAAPKRKTPPKAKQRELLEKQGNTRGEVVGINSQIFSNSGGYMGVSFAIPIDVAMNAVHQIKTTGRVSRGQLGVQVQDVPREMVEALGLGRPRGALVAQVLPGSPAERAGIERGDVIVAFNGTELGGSAELPPLVGAMAPGSRTTVTVLRDGRERTLSVVLSELDEGTASATPAAEPAGRHANPLGIVGEDLTAEERRRLGLGAKEGVAIARIEGLAARRAGLQPGDVVLAVGRKSVGSVAELDAELRALRPGQPTMLLIRRGNATQYVAVTPRAQEQ